MTFEEFSKGTLMPIVNYFALYVAELQLEAQNEGAPDPFADYGPDEWWMLFEDYVNNAK